MNSKFKKKWKWYVQFFFILKKVTWVDKNIRFYQMKAKKKKKKLKYKKKHKLNCK